ncbi:hypothetical protein [Knoellia koreensis]|uniref:Lipoprotein n=1 Tax=Knoellia koreensis TaxID=2730921 RepID=A0A849HGX3_9MICO|nr:hypothetical protein [Knoellia sp. DB2414S]NNM46668.1 hypothetical protein [Knoellia sp. DB2414S]
MLATRALRATAVAAVAGAVLAVSGCATADTAAVVDGHRITEAEAQEAAAQIREVQPDSGLETSGAVQSLVMAQFINQVAEKSGKALADSAARTAVPQLQDPAPSTLELVKASLAFNQMTEGEKAQAVDLARKADITVNPRYGVFKPSGSALFESSAPNWIKADTSTPEPDPLAPQN